MLAHTRKPQNASRPNGILTQIFLSVKAVRCHRLKARRAKPASLYITLCLLRVPGLVDVSTRSSPSIQPRECTEGHHICIGTWMAVSQDPHNGLDLRRPAANRAAIGLISNAMCSMTIQPLVAHNRPHAAHVHRYALNALLSSFFFLSFRTFFHSATDFGSEWLRLSAHAFYTVFSASLSCIKTRTQCREKCKVVSSSGACFQNRKYLR